MELVDLPKVEEKNELSDFQKENLFDSIVRGKDVIEKIETSRGVFEIKFPRAKDLETIGRLTAYRLNGINEKCFDNATYALIQQIATLDVVVRSGPAWFETAKKENVNFSWGDIPSQKFISEVYAKAFEFRLKVQNLLDEDSEGRNKEMAAAKGNENAGSPGVFSGISSSEGK